MVNSISNDPTSARLAAQVRDRDTSNRTQDEAESGRAGPDSDDTVAVSSGGRLLSETSLATPIQGAAIETPEQAASLAARIRKQIGQAAGIALQAQAGGRQDIGSLLESSPA